MPNRIEHLRVAANGIHFHAAVAGPTEAPPILFLHGFPEYRSHASLTFELSEKTVGP